ncbi:hypothetical protein HDU97_003382 [Phlyctochytrium planicorne]|nr:hypothetical protein HDU97_003382 [Phlyctochytrium planicorne]
MFVGGRARPSTQASGLGGTQDAEVLRHANPRLEPYPTPLNWYGTPPAYEVTLTDFELFALDRLHVLKAIENCTIRNRGNDETAKIVKAISDKCMPMLSNMHIKTATPETLVEQREKDHISHYILRLAFCRTEDNRIWLLRQETLLFKHRFEEATRLEKELFLRGMNLAFEVLTPEERHIFQNDLRTLHGDKSEQTFFKVPFERVLPLVAKRLVLVHRGYALVPESEQSVVVTSIFKEHLQSELETTARSIPRMEEDDRLIPVLNSIARQCVSREYNVQFDPSNPQDVITDAEIDPLSRSGHFPLCMSKLVDVLKSDGHLKHFGRLQLGLFIKGIGVPMEEALAYWKKAFTKTTGDKFDKEYAYNIRFNYGREGSRKDYTPFSCQRIIVSNPPGPGDHHGCPYRFSSPEVLRAMVVKAGVSESNSGEVVKLAKEGHYQLACTRVFELTRGPAIRDAAEKPPQDAASSSSSAQPSGTTPSIFTSDGTLIETIEHPNQYFDLSYRGSSTRHARRNNQNYNKPQNNDEEMDVDR